jgi:hypothetical protein
MLRKLDLALDLYPGLTYPAAAQIAQRTPPRPASLARALVGYYYGLSPRTVQSLLSTGRWLAQGAARKRAQGA